MASDWKPVLAVFYCGNLDEGNLDGRAAIERSFEGSVRLFPLPCSGRLDGLHLLRALEDFADAAYVVTCPLGTCRYFEGNRWAARRVEVARRLIEAIGLEGERVGLVSKTTQQDLKSLISLLVDRVSSLGPSAVLYGRKTVKEMAGVK